MTCTVSYSDLTERLDTVEDLDEMLEDLLRRRGWPDDVPPYFRFRHENSEYAGEWDVDFGLTIDGSLGFLYYRPGTFQYARMPGQSYLQIYPGAVELTFHEDPYRRMILVRDVVIDGRAAGGAAREYVRTGERPAGVAWDIAGRSSSPP